jgi:hypothetical protein
VEPASPPSVRAIVEGCLKKEHAQRIGDIAVAQFLLHDSNPAAPAVAPPIAVPAASRTWKTVAPMLFVTTVGGVCAGVYLVRPQAPPAITRFLIDAPKKATFVTALRTGTSPVIAPDGKRLAYTRRDEAGKVLIWIRALDALAAQPLPGTDDAEFPFWAPVSQWVGRFTWGKLLKINASGGPPVALCRAEGARGGT